MNYKLPRSHRRANLDTIFHHLVNVFGGLLPGELRTLAAIQTCCARSGGCCTFRDVARVLDCQINNVREMVVRLQKKNYVTWVPRIARSIRPLYRIELFLPVEESAECE